VAGPLAVGAAAAIALAVGSGGGSQAPVAGGSSSVRSPDVVIAVRGLAGEVSQLLTTTPLDTELDNLVHDGKRGLTAILATGGLR